MTKDEELAFDLALEALNSPAYGKELRELQDKAITAIKQARSAPVQCEWCYGRGVLAGYAHDGSFDGEDCPHCTPPAQPAPVQESVGNWVWSWLMDWCKRNGIAPATRDSLFAMVKDARSKFDTTPPAQPAPVQEPTVWTATRLWNRRELWTCPADIERDLLESYTTPPAAQPAPVPLTEPLVRKLWSDAHNDTTDRMAFEVFARLLEEAHNITEKKP